MDLARWQRMTEDAVTWALAWRTSNSWFASHLYKTGFMKFMHQLPCTPGKVATEGVRGLLNVCGNWRTSSQARGERLPEYVTTKRAIRAKTRLWFSVLGFPLDSAMPLIWGDWGVENHTSNFRALCLPLKFLPPFRNKQVSDACFICF